MSRFLIAIVLLLTACKSAVIRDAKVYDTELTWFQQAGEETAELAAVMVERHCVCVDGTFEDVECEMLADNIVTIRSRMSWHVEMARYNAGLTEKKPNEEPSIPSAESLCP